MQRLGMGGMRDSCRDSVKSPLEHSDGTKPPLEHPDGTEPSFGHPDGTNPSFGMLYASNMTQNVV